MAGRPVCRCVVRLVRRRRLDDAFAKDLRSAAKLARRRLAQGPESPGVSQIQRKNDGDLLRIRCVKECVEALTRPADDAICLVINSDPA